MKGSKKAPATYILVRSISEIHEIGCPNAIPDGPAHMKIERRVDKIEATVTYNSCKNLIAIM